MSVDILLRKLNSDDVQEQFEGWIWADDIGPVALKPLSEMYLSNDPRKVRAAEEAMDRIVHSVGKSTDHPNRKDAVSNLHDFLRSDEYKLKVYALRALSYIGGEDSVPEVMREIENPRLREETVFSLERIPGSAPEVALLSALPRAEDSFKPRIIYALGRRGVVNSVEVLAKLTQSDEAEIAIRSWEAIANIGKWPEGLNIDPKRFEGRHRTMYYDNLLRLADAEAQNGNRQRAVETYKRILDQDEETIGEHLHCAAIIGLAVIKTDESRKLIEDAKGKAISYVVKDTAERVLTR